MNFQAGEGIIDVNVKSYRQIKVNLVFGERRVRLESKMPRVKILSSAERKRAKSRRKARRQSGDMDDSMRGSDH